MAIFLLAFLVRLYRIKNPILDWHSWRQADTASVTREYIKHGINLLRPTYHDLSTIPNNLDNSTHGYRMVEFPMINALIALLIKIFPNLNLVITSRLVSIGFSLGSLTCLYFLVKKISGQTTASLTAFIFAILPYNIYYSRVILPEPGMLFFSLLAILAFQLFLETSKFVWWLSSLLALALAFLLKPFVVFLAPVFISLAWLKYQKKIFIQWKIFALAGLSLLPFIAWRNWIAQFPEGIPASSWLFNSNGIRFRPAWFRWLFYERFTKLFLGFSAVVFLPFNFLKRSKDLLIYASWWLGILIYFIVIATGNVHHDYYQILTVPIVCISLARGIIIAFQFLKKKINFHPALIICSLIIACSTYLAWQEVKGYFNINHWEYFYAGQAANKLTPSNAKIIAPAMGDTMFLFQTNRTGWPIGGDIDVKISQGATHYLTTSYDDEAKKLTEKYQVLIKNDKFLLLDLKSLKL